MRSALCILALAAMPAWAQLAPGAPSGPAAADTRDMKPPPRLLSPEEQRRVTAAPGDLRPERPATPQVVAPLHRPRPALAAPARPQHVPTPAQVLTEANERCTQGDDHDRIACRRSVERDRLTIAPTVR